MSLCVVRVVGPWCIRLRACVALRACAAVLAESGNDISPKRAISPKRVLPTVAQYIVYFRSERWCGYRIWRSFRKRHLWHSLSGVGYKAKDATIVQNKSLLLAFTIMTKLFETRANMYITHNSILPNCHLYCPCYSYLLSIKVHYHMYTLAFAF